MVDDQYILADEMKLLMKDFYLKIKWIKWCNCLRKDWFLCVYVCVLVTEREKGGGGENGVSILKMCSLEREMLFAVNQHQ